VAKDLQPNACEVCMTIIEELADFFHRQSPELSDDECNAKAMHAFTHSDEYIEILKNLLNENEQRID
jgi:hypothetical protein